MEAPSDYSWGQIRKTVVAAASASVVILALAMAQGDLIPESWTKWAVFLVSLGNVYGVFKIKNDPAPESDLIAPGPTEVG